MTVILADRTLTVAAIKNGTVIDHITQGQALHIVRILKLNKHLKKVSLGLNLPSKSIKYKDLIKVEDKELNEDEANQVSILAPTATINIIKDFEVIKKFQVKTPKMIENVLICPNPKCISNHENVETYFSILQHQQRIGLECKYCKKRFSHSDIKEYRS